LASASVVVMQLRVHRSAAEQLAQWYFKECVLKTTCCSAAVTVLCLAACDGGTRNVIAMKRASAAVIRLMSYLCVAFGL
jgi:hypothetical protein